MEGEKHPSDKSGSLLGSLAANEEQLAGLPERIVKAIDGYVSKREKHMRALESGRAKFVARMTLAPGLRRTRWPAPAVLRMRATCGPRAPVTARRPPTSGTSDAGLTLTTTVGRWHV